MYLDYALTIFVIAISGNPAAPIFGKDGTYIIAFLVLMYLWVRRPVPIERSALIFPAVIAGLALLHLFSFGSIVLMASLGFLIKIAIGILAATVIDNFFRKFVRWMAILTCVSLVFYIPSVFGIDLSGPLSFLNVSFETREGLSAIRHIGIHNFHHEGETRNSGMFWEPGAFAGYLVLALFVVAACRDKKVFARWEVVALVAGLLSTQSTMGYLAGMIVGAYYLTNRFAGERGLATLPFLPVVLIAGGLATYVMVTEVDFIGDKIQEQILHTQDARDRHEITRFGNMLYDLDSIKQRPLTGWSGNPETRFALDPELAELIAGQGSALTGFWVRFGAIGWFAFFWALYVATIRGSNGPVSGFFLVGITAALLVGEQYTNFPLIYAFIIGIRINEPERDNSFTNTPSPQISRGCA